MAGGLLVEEEGHGGGLAEEGDVEALVESADALAAVDELEGVVDAAVLGHQVVARLPVVA